MRIPAASARSLSRIYKTMRIAGLCGRVSAKNHDVESAVLKHAKRGNLRRLVRALDRCRNSPNNVRDEMGRTALHLAAIGGHKECLKELLRRRTNPNMLVKYPIFKGLHHNTKPFIQSGPRRPYGLSCADLRRSSCQISSKRYCHHPKPISSHISLCAWDLSHYGVLLVRSVDVQAMSTVPYPLWS